GELHADAAWPSHRRSVRSVDPAEGGRGSMLAAEGFELLFPTLYFVAGAEWAGSAFLFTVFIEPAAAKLGPAAGPFMEETIGRRKVPEILTSSARVAGMSA